MITAILCAAGRGVRAGFPRNKILEELNGLPLLAYSLSAFSREDIGEILVVCNPGDEPSVAPLLRACPAARLCKGGATRSESVYNALRIAKGDVVLIHDAARPFVSQKIISDCIASVKEYGSGVCALPVTDTVVLSDGDRVINSPARETVYTVQTPQGFFKEPLLLAYEKARRDQRAFTDDGGVYTAYIGPARLFAGERENRKLTYPEDFRMAERVGFGTDTHRFETEEDGPLPFIGFIVLCGVKIPSPKRIVAHSDGDVAIHALMDALLSAAGLRDIGYYFPDTDERFAGADSTELLKETLRLVRERGLAPKNVSISVLAEFPRLAPHIESMKKNLAEILGLDERAVGIAAGTNEKLGYVGEGKGITCYAAALLCKIP